MGRSKSVFNKKPESEGLGHICKAEVDEPYLSSRKSNIIEFNSAQLNSTEINSIIEEDKQYGVFQPFNGEHYTYRVLNEDEEITNEKVLKSIEYSYRRISLRTNLKFRRAREGEYADLRIEFRTVDTDPEKELQSSTLMYHYYPISNSTHRLRGLCVVNKDYFWTTAGGSLDMHYIDPEHYPEPNSGYGGKTYDLDQVYTHEVLHGLGLPHSKTAGNVMSPNYGIMAEWMSDEDIARIQAKYGSRNISESRIKRWLKWLKIASER